LPSGNGYNEVRYKTNSHLSRGILTGITRISKESIFSDLNNLEVVTTTSTEYQTCFGFIEDEVFRTLDARDLGRESDFGRYDVMIVPTHG